jgi:putative hydrolase of the HAD superfamily
VRFKFIMTLSKPKAILLDLDDTIIDLTRATENLWRVISEQFAPQAGVSAIAFADALNHTRTWFWDGPDRHREWRMKINEARGEIVRHALQRLSVDAPHIPLAVSQIDESLLFDGIQPFPNAIETLHHFRAQGMRLALLTNGASAPQRRKIEQFKLAPFFDCILIEGEFGVGKPDERVYRHALQQLNVQPHETWMVGDRLEWEVAAPQRVGIAGIWVDYKQAGLPPNSTIQPDHVVQTIAELHGLIG